MKRIINVMGLTLTIMLVLTGCALELTQQAPEPIVNYKFDKNILGKSIYGYDNDPTLNEENNYMFTYCHNPDYDDYDDMLRGAAIENHPCKTIYLNATLDGEIYLAEFTTESLDYSESEFLELVHVFDPSITKEDLRILHGEQPFDHTKDWYWFSKTYDHYKIDIEHNHGYRKPILLEGLYCNVSVRLEKLRNE